jgi:hypothetical protein
MIKDHRKRSHQKSGEEEGRGGRVRPIGAADATEHLKDAQSMSKQVNVKG